MRLKSGREKREFAPSPLCCLCLPRIQQWGPEPSLALALT